MASYSKYARTIIKIVGIGGAGCNMITDISQSIGTKIRDLMFKDDLDNLYHENQINKEPLIIAMNTDHQSLNKTVAECKIQLGSDGLGAGCNPDIAREAAEYSKEDIQEALKGSSLVILFAGLGKGTGSGATAVVARIAKEMGILVIVICTKPFGFDGQCAKIIAEKSFEEISKTADCTVPLNNSLLHKVVHDNTPIKEAFAYIDDFVKDVVIAIINSLKQTGLMNVDYSDLKTVIESAGLGIVSCGEGEGDDAASKAIEVALNNPILDQQNISGAASAFIYTAGSAGMSLLDVEKIVNAVSSRLNNPRARIIHGTSLDDSIGNEIFIRDSASGEKRIKVLVIITGIKEAPKQHNDDKDIDVIEFIDVDNIKNTEREEVIHKYDNTTTLENELTLNINKNKKEKKTGFFSSLVSWIA